MTTARSTAVRREPTARLALAVCAVLAAVAIAPPAGAEERVRRNIDDLAPDELADYVHAVAKLKEISRQNPASKDGYTYLAELHNEIDVGPCEHASDTFLPWHRAHLLEFEDALRRSDPPRTAQVTVPYWDWSELPSGVRYPRAFEDPSSVLFDGLRERTAICRSGGATNCEPLSFPRSYLDAEVLSAMGWMGVGSKYFGGRSNEATECLSRRRTGYGSLESPAHNDMHSSYVGGLMISASTAAEDPIFWSFHAYLDLLLDQWQAMPKRAIDTCIACKLCGLVKRDGKPWTVRDTLSTSALGYRYEYGPAVPPPIVLGQAAPEAARLFPPLPASGMALSGKLPIDVLREREVVIPEAVEEPVELRLDGVPRSTAFSYNGDVYLYPSGADFLPRDAGFRTRHMVGLYSVFAGHAGHAGHGDEDSDEIEIVIDLTDELRALAERHAGETWILAIALVANTLSAESRIEAAAAAFGDAGSFAEAMSFDSLTLEGLP